MNSRVKPLPSLLGLIALGLLSTVAACSQTPTSATPSKESTIAESPNPDPSMRRSNFLNLTADQQTKIEQIRQNQRSQIEAILTQEQKNQLQQERENRKSGTGENRRTPRTGENRQMGPFASLNLTAEQRSKIEAVMRSSREQMDTVLTPEQRQQLQQRQRQQPQGSIQGQQGNTQAT